MVVFHSYAEFPEGSYRNPRVYVEPTCLDELHWIVTITTSLRRHYRLWLVSAIILKLPCSVRWVTLIIMYPDVWHTYLHLLQKISRRKAKNIYISEMDGMGKGQVMSSRSIKLPVSLLSGKPTQHFHTFPILLSTNPLKKNMVPLCSTTYSIVPPIKSPFYRHVCFIPHVLQFRTFFIDQIIFSAWNHTFWLLLGGGYNMFYPHR